jgi:hypothetical protein
MACLLAGTKLTKSLVLFGGWQAACRLDCYKINASYTDGQHSVPWWKLIILHWSMTVGVLPDSIVTAYITACRHKYT